MSICPNRLAEDLFIRTTFVTLLIIIEFRTIAEHAATCTGTYSSENCIDVPDRSITSRSASVCEASPIDVPFTNG